MRKFTRAFLFITFTFFLGACTRSYAPAATPHTCDLDIQLFVHQGDSAGQAISGVVEFGTHSWGSFTGELVGEGGHSYPISFSFNGNSVHFTVEHEDGGIFASGMMESDLSFCMGSGGGTLSGPLVGDLGDWRGEFFATVLPTPTPDPNTENTSTNTHQSSFFTLLLCIYSPVILFVLILAFFLIRYSRKNKKDH